MEKNEKSNELLEAKKLDELAEYAKSELQVDKNKNVDVSIKYGVLSIDKCYCDFAPWRGELIEGSPHPTSWAAL